MVTFYKFQGGFRGAPAEQPAHFPSVARQEINPQSTPKTYNLPLAASGKNETATLKPNYKI